MGIGEVGSRSGWIRERSELVEEVEEEPAWKKGD